MASPDRGGLIDYQGGCYSCGVTWWTRNVVGLAAKHAQKHDDHEVWVELGHSYRWGPAARAENQEARERQALKSA